MTTPTMRAIASVTDIVCLGPDLFSIIRCFQFGSGIGHDLRQPIFSTPHRRVLSSFRKPALTGNISESVINAFRKIGLPPHPIALPQGVRGG